MAEAKGSSMGNRESIIPGSGFTRPGLKIYNG
jgi:hypothetical protein